MAGKKRTASKSKRRPSPQATPQRIELKLGQEVIVCHGKPRPGSHPPLKKLRRGQCIRIRAVGGPGESSKSPNP